LDEIMWSRNRAVIATATRGLLGEDTGDLFDPAGDNWRSEGWLAQIGWIRTLGHEGGLFVTVGRRDVPSGD